MHACVCVCVCERERECTHTHVCMHYACVCVHAVLFAAAVVVTECTGHLPEAAIDDEENRNDEGGQPRGIDNAKGSEN